MSITNTTTIITPTPSYDYSGIYLGPPQSILGGSYFTKLLNNSKPLFVQTQPCTSKGGFIKHGKNTYIDLLIENSDTVFINWIEHLEAHCVDLLYTNRENLFQNDIDKDDIEGAFSSVLKIYKSGKYYTLRVAVKSPIVVYSETSDPKSMDDVDSESTVISILEIYGIKYTTRNFQIDIGVKQIMIVSPDPFSNKCFIRVASQKPQNVVADGPVAVAEADVVETVHPLLSAEAAPIVKEECEEKTDDDIKEIDICPTMGDTEDLPIKLKTPDDIYMSVYLSAKSNLHRLMKEVDDARSELNNLKKMYDINDE